MNTQSLNENSFTKFIENVKKDKATFYTGVSGVANMYPDKMEIGGAKITKYEFKESENPLYNLRAMRDGGRIFEIYDGEYVRLVVNGELMMSDTPMERYSNRDFIENANGRVFIAGLGIGLIIKAIIDKPEVEEVVVVEKYKDVIDMVAPKFSHPKLKIVEADIFEYKMGKEEKYDTIYFDIWPKISIENLDEMRVLHARFKYHKRSKESYMESWMRDFLRKRKRSGY